MKYCRECKISFNGEKYKQKDAWGNWFYPCPQCREDYNIEEGEKVNEVDDEDIKKAKKSPSVNDAGNGVGEVVVRVKKVKEKKVPLLKKELKKELSGVPKCSKCGSLGGQNYVRLSTHELVCRRCGGITKGKMLNGKGWQPL